MIGMLQILTYLLSVYLVMKGVEILQIGITSSRPSRVFPITIGVLALAACIAAALAFSIAQDQQATQISRSMPNLPQ